MLKQIGSQAKDAAAEIAVLSTDKKNQILQTMADELLKNSKKILDATVLDRKKLINPQKLKKKNNAAVLAALSPGIVNLLFR